MDYPGMQIDILEEFSDAQALGPPGTRLREVGAGFLFKDPAKHAEYVRNWRARNPLKWAQISRPRIARWKKANPEKCAAYAATYRARKSAELWAKRRATGCTCRSRGGHANVCAIKKAAK